MKKQLQKLELVVTTSPPGVFIEKQPRCFSRVGFERPGNSNSWLKNDGDESGTVFTEDIDELSVVYVRRPRESCMFEGFNTACDKRERAINQAMCLLSVYADLVEITVED